MQETAQCRSVCAGKGCARPGADHGRGDHHTVVRADVGQQPVSESGSMVPAPARPSRCITGRAPRMRLAHTAAGAFGPPPIAASSRIVGSGPPITTAVSRTRSGPRARAYLARRTAEGKTTLETAAASSATWSCGRRWGLRRQQSCSHRGTRTMNEGRALPQSAHIVVSGNLSRRGSARSRRRAGRGRRRRAGRLPPGRRGARCLPG